MANKYFELFNIEYRIGWQKMNRFSLIIKDRRMGHYVLVSLTTGKLQKLYTRFCIFFKF